ncbi:MAG TPA: YciI family protein [Polaromonas sp.]|jgi:hypothetical protein
MQYMLVYMQTASDLALRTDPAQAPAYWDAWRAYMAALRQSGMMLSGHGLQPPETGTTVRVRHGKRVIQDGPFADTKEHLGGYAILEAPSLDMALRWAERAPCATSGSVEVRPIMPTIAINA